MVESVRASIALVTFMFINLVLFIGFSGPFGLLLGHIEDEAGEIIQGNDKSAEYRNDVTGYLDNFRLIFGLMFVASAIGLIVWFFMGTHERSYEEY